MQASLVWREGRVVEDTRDTEHLEYMEDENLV